MKKNEARKKSTALVKGDGDGVEKSYAAWIADLKRRYRATQIKAAVAVNTALIEFYWNLGKDISEKYAATGDMTSDTGEGLLAEDAALLPFILSSAEFSGKDAGTYTYDSASNTGGVNYIVSVDTANVGTKTDDNGNTIANAAQLMGNYTFDTYTLDSYDTATKKANSSSTVPTVETLSDSGFVIGHGDGEIYRRTVNVALKDYEGLDKTYDGNNKVKTVDRSGDTTKYINKDNDHN